MRIYVTGHCFPCRGKKSNLNLITMEADIRTTDYKQYLLQQGQMMNARAIMSVEVRLINGEPVTTLGMKTFPPF